MATTEEINVKPLSVMLLIGSLEFGGAERQVVELSRTFDRSRINPIVCSLSKEVPLAKFLRDPQKDLIIVEKHGKYDLSTVTRLAKIVKERRIDVIHAFLFDSEIASRLAGAIAKTPVVLGSERNSNYKRRRLHSTLLNLTRNLASGIIANSQAGKDFYASTLNFNPSRIHVVHNGIDTDRFFPNPAGGKTLRERFGIPKDAIVVGIVASFKQQKRHGDFLKIARIVADRIPKVRFLFAGEPLRENQQGAGDYHQEIQNILIKLQLTNQCHMIGNCSDIENVYNACDIKLLTSSREGTPNVLLEAMACGVPVIATDIADNSKIVLHGETGFIAPLGDIEKIASHTMTLIEDKKLRQRLGIAGRKRVSKEFSLDALTRKTGAVYLSYFHQTINKNA